MVTYDTPFFGIHRILRVSSLDERRETTSYHFLLNPLEISKHCLQTDTLTICFLQFSTEGGLIFFSQVLCNLRCLRTAVEVHGPH